MKDRAETPLGGGWADDEAGAAAGTPPQQEVELVAAVP